MRQIKMTIGSVALEAELFETPTAEAIWNALPFVSRANTWGEEVYFSAPVKVKLESDARDVVSPGDAGPDHGDPHVGTIPAWRTSSGTGRRSRTIPSHERATST